ncbi:hypothetical protein EVAR_94574_1 [Eumeta japonica]|uniref:Uncharacterized protein n=1 Tax=Eumeta variegata TaxID=151549 RepID=A0A4C1UUT6_EUMVA|nr:hypothetical protein EVAR_94574_1 [Eumeta japonica]
MGEMLGSTLDQGVCLHPRARRQTYLLQLRNRSYGKLRMVPSSTDIETSPHLLKGNQIKNPLPWVNTQQTKGTDIKDSQKQPLRQAGTAASALGDDIATIKSILQVVRSTKFANLVAKLRKAKHGVDHLKIILENQELIRRRRSDRLDIALMRGVALNVRCIETLQSLNSEDRPVLLRLGEHISEGFNKKQKTLAVFFALTKAFDRAATYELPPAHHFLRRPPNILSDRPDALTLLVEKLIDIRHHDPKGQLTGEFPRLRYPFPKFSGPAKNLRDLLC